VGEHRFLFDPSGVLSLEPKALFPQHSRAKEKSLLLYVFLDDEDHRVGLYLTEDRIALSNGVQLCEVTHVRQVFSH
jgi:hypothetical protein